MQFPMNQKIRAKVVGATGYGGLGIIDLLLRHPFAEIGALVARDDAGRRISDVYPHLAGYCDLPILAGVACDGDEDLAAARARMQALGQDLSDALAYVHAHPGGKAYHDLHARQLVDAAIAVVVSALFIRFAAKFPEKKAALDFWIQTRFPAARAALEQARSGFLAPVTDFERIAPLPPLADEA